MGEARTIVAGRGMPGKDDANYRLYSDDTILLFGVRARHIHVGKPFQGKPDKETGKVPAPKFNGKFMLPKSTHTNASKLIEREIGKLLAKNNIDDLPAANKCLKDGDFEGKPELKGHMVINISENIDHRPALRGAKGERYTVEAMGEHKIDGVFYPGATYNVLLNLWYQPGYGRKVNANLRAVQFAADGERFSSEGGINDDEIDDAFGVTGDVGGFDDGPAPADDDL